MWAQSFVRIRKMIRDLETRWANHRVQQRWDWAKWELDSTWEMSWQQESRKAPLKFAPSPRDCYKTKVNSSYCLKLSKDSPLLLIQCKPLNMFSMPLCPLPLPSFTTNPWAFCISFHLFFTLILFLFRSFESAISSEWHINLRIAPFVFRML